MNCRALKIIVINSIKNSLVFKGSLIAKMMTVILSDISSVCVILLMLSRFQGYGQFSSGQFVFMFIFSHLSYSICMLLFHNLRRLGKAVQSGFLDRILLIPMNTMVYICISDFELANVGQFIISNILLFIFRNNFGFYWSVKKILFCLTLLFCSILILASILIVLSAAAFFVIEWKPLDNMFGALKEMLGYPITIYNPVVQFILYSFIPMAYIVYVPTNLIFRESGDMGIEMLILLSYLGAAVLLFYISCRFWFCQLKKYQSVG